MESREFFNTTLKNAGREKSGRSGGVDGDFMIFRSGEEGEKSSQDDLYPRQSSFLFHVEGKKCQCKVEGRTIGEEVLCVQKTPRPRGHQKGQKRD